MTIDLFLTHWNDQKDAVKGLELTFRNLLSSGRGVAKKGQRTLLYCFW